MTSIVRQNLINSLKGQSVLIPNLHTILLYWSHSVNPAIKRLHDDVDRRLDRSVFFSLVNILPLVLADMLALLP